MKKTQVPKFKTEAEVAAFWDTHDTMDFDFEDDFETVFVRPEVLIVEVRANYGPSSSRCNEVEAKPQNG